MITYFLFLLLISCAFCANLQGNDTKDECIKDLDCFLLNKEIISQISTSVDPCIDIHSYMCSNNERFSGKLYLQRRLSEMKAYLITLLDLPPDTNDNDMLVVEKSLYKSCILLGSTHQNSTYSERLKSQLDNLGGIGLWQDVEYVIFSLGFGFTFFDIKVIPHPRHEGKSAIMLQPPSLEKIKSMNNKIKKIIAYKQQYRKSRYSDQAQAVHDLYNFMNENVEYEVLRFFETLQQAKLGLLAHSTDFPQHYTTVKQLNNLTIHTYVGPDIGVKVDWINIIRRLLQSKKIDYDTDNVILKNPRYFLHLTKLLHDTPNNVIVATIQTKALTDNLAYVDWERSNLLERIDRVEFCLRETNLYGASHKMVHDWLTVDDDRRSTYTKSENIFSSVMSTLQTEIALYNSSVPFEATYYKTKLFYVIENLYKYVYDPPYNLYYTLNISSESYFDNIISYRKLLMNEELQRLKDNLGSSRSFSFNDQDEPENRFVINTLINIADMLPPNFPKEAHYGTFGVRTAELIHSLLHEDTFNDDLSETVKKLVHPKYPDNVETCVRQNLHFRYSAERVDEVITQVLGLNTAYKALLHDEFTPFHSIASGFLSHHNVTKEKLFFLAYVRDNCDLESGIVNGILSDNRAFDKTFHCEMNVIEGDKTCMLGKV